MAVAHIGTQAQSPRACSIWAFINYGFHQLWFIHRFC